MDSLDKFVSDLGFPIAIAIALLYQNFSIEKVFQKTVDSFRLSLDQNTKTLNELIDKIEDNTKKE